MADAEARLGVDVGGTFTDLVLIAGDRLVTAKVPSTPRRPVRGRHAQPGGGRGHRGRRLRARDDRGHQRAARAPRSSHRARDHRGLPRRDRDRPPGPRRALRPHGRPPAGARPARAALHGARADGARRRARAARRGRASRRRSRRSARPRSRRSRSACCSASCTPSTSRRSARRCARRCDDVHVSLSSEVLPEFREYERTSTTVADAYLAPRLGAYLEQLAGRARGGRAAGAAGHAVLRRGRRGRPPPPSRRRRCVLSGPAGGVVGAAYAAQASGFEDVLTFDMGGTSTDVAPIVGGEAQTTTESVVAGVPIKLPMVDVHTVSAGGGSLAWADAGGALRVGPESAGADPGPAAYGRGGEEPTVTDANLFLGYLGDGAELGGEVRSAASAPRRRSTRVGGRLDLDAEATALGIVRVANAEMTRALRVISVRARPRPARLRARRLRRRRRDARLRAGRGARDADGDRAARGGRAQRARPRHLRRAARPRAPAARRAGRGGDGGGLHSAGGRGRRARAAPPRRRALSPPVLRADVDADDLGELAEGFHAAHERRYGYRMEEEPLELVNVRLVATTPVDKPPLRGRAGRRRTPAQQTRRACFDGDWSEVPRARARVARPRRHGRGARDRRAGRGDLRRAPGWQGEVDDAGTLVLRGR